MIIYTTKEMIEEFGEKETDSRIYRFKCKREKNIESELKHRIVLIRRETLQRTLFSMRLIIIRFWLFLH